MRKSTRQKFLRTGILFIVFIFIITTFITFIH